MFETHIYLFFHVHIWLDQNLFEFTMGSYQRLAAQLNANKQVEKMISGSKYLSANILLIPNCIKYHPILGVHELVISIFLWRASVTFLDARHIFEVAYAHDSLQ